MAKVRKFAGIAALFLALAACMTGTIAQPQAPTARDGVLDLRDIDLSGDAIVGLRGDWRIAWGRFEEPGAPPEPPAAGGLIAVPGTWNDATPPGKSPGAFGHATYRLTVLCNGSPHLALSLPLQSSALRLYVNGRIAAVQGSPGGAPELARPLWQQQIAPLEEVSCPLKIVAHVSNFEMRLGGLVRDIEIGSERALRDRRERGIARDLLSLGGLAVLSLLPILFWFWRRSDWASLWLGLYVLSSALFIGISGERLLQPLLAPLGWDGAWRVAFLTLVAGLATFPAFLNALYAKTFPRIALRLILGGCGLYALIIALTPARVFTQLGPVLIWGGMLVALLCYGVLARAALQRRAGAWTLMAGLTVLVASTAHDVAQTAYQLAGKLTPYGMFLFSLAPAVLLARRFARALRAEELRTVEAAQRVDLLVSATQAGLLDWDAVARRTTYSGRLKEMLGHPGDADTSRWPSLLELIHPEDRARIGASFERNINDRSVKGGVRRWIDSPDFRVRRADGSHIWIHGEAISITDAEGRTMRHICSFQEITERKRQELELADRIKFTRDLIESVPIALALRDTEGRYLVVNRKWEEYFGATRDEVVGRSVRERASPRMADAVLALDRAVLERGPGAVMQENDFEYRGRSFTQTRSVMTGQSGVLGVLIASIDTSERARMERELESEQRRLDLVVRAQRVGIVDWDGSTRATFYSPRFRQILGHAPDADTSGWPDYFKVLIHPEDRESVTARWRAFILGKSGEGLGSYYAPEEYRLLRADGGYVWVEVTGLAVRDARGFVTRWIASVTDVTEQREQREALKESVRLREEVDRISRHDLKTPLNSIIGIPRLLRDSGRLSTEDTELLAFVEQAGYRLLGMVNLSLDMFRMEQDSYPLSPKPVDLRQVLRKVSHDLKQLAAARRVAIEIDGPHLHVLGEELLCYSMLANLVKNAVEACPEGGSVRITVEGDAETACVAVHNPGTVPEAVRTRFFEKYSTSGKPGGTGLGTYSARLIARTQKGDIAMRSTVADGTTVTVRLPAATAPAEPQSLPEAVTVEPLPMSLPFSVLVVDDDDYTRLIVQRFLPANARSATASNGREALDAVKAATQDAVVMDLDMPVMGGIEAAGRLRQWEKESGRARCALIAMSSHDDAAVRRQALQAGFDLYLEKPVSPDALRGALASLVRSPGPGDAVRVDPDLRHALPGFLASRRELAAQLAQLLDSGSNADQARTLAHKLAGSLSLYGFHWAAGQGKMIENRLRELALEGLAAEARALCRHLDAVELAQPENAEENRGMGEKA